MADSIGPKIPKSGLYEQKCGVISSFSNNQSEDLIKVTK